MFLFGGEQWAARERDAVGRLVSNSFAARLASHDAVRRGVRPSRGRVALPAKAMAPGSSPPAPCGHSARGSAAHASSIIQSDLCRRARAHGSAKRRRRFSTLAAKVVGSARDSADSSRYL